MTDWTNEEGREFAAALEWALMTREERETVLAAQGLDLALAESHTPPQ